MIGEIKPEHLNSSAVEPNTQWFLSGPTAMVTAVAEILVSSKVKPSNILCEEHFPVVLRDSEVTTAQKLDLNAERFKMAVESASDHITFTDVDGNIVYANKAAEQLTGYSKQEMIGSTPRLWGGLMGREFYEQLWDTIRNQKKVFAGEITNRRKNGETYTTLARISPLFSVNNKLTGFVGTEEDISALEQVNRAKTEFVSLASHQLKTPLTAINWYTELLMSGDFGKTNRQQEKYLKEVSRSSHRMVELVNSLLNVSRLEMGTFTIEPTSTDLFSVCQSVIKEISSMTRKRKIHLTPSHGQRLSKLMADEKLFRMIVQNLLTNAVKYSAIGGKVTIDVSQRERGWLCGPKILVNDSIVITVSDNGCGIPKQQQRQIFTKLFRADNVRAKDTDGTGLGLYIVKSILDESGGSIWFESKENVGTTFYVAIPISGMKQKAGTKALS